MRYSSVESTTTVPPMERRRFGLLPCSKCRRPARARSTLPLAVILNRFATDFLVLMPLGRRINAELSLTKRARNISAWPPSTQALFSLSLLYSHVSAREPVCPSPQPSPRGRGRSCARALAFL